VNPVRVIHVLGLLALATAVSLSAQTATVDFGSSQQTIVGFGGATAWLPALSSSQANTLFSNGNNSQLGLSILRVRIDPGGSGNWGTELSNAQAAQSRGAYVIATPWTPPASMKSNNNTVGGSLNTSSYGAYATYLNSFVTYMKNGGVNLYAISMQNEPDANVTYESCGWTGQQMDNWVAGNGGSLSTKLYMPESESFNTSYSDPTLNDGNAVGHVSAIAGHLYGTSPSYYSNAFSKGKQVWMTEHYISGSGISNALSVAKEINDSMSTGDYSAYVWWWVEDVSSQNSYTGLIDSNGNVKAAGYAMGQYSKFVRPNYVRSNATYNPQGSVYVTAYKGSGNFVIVAINMGGSSVSQTFSIQNQSLGSFIPYQTSGSALYIQQLGTVNTSNNSFTYTLPAQSITTFVGQAGGGGGGGGGSINTSAWYEVINQTSGQCMDDTNFGTSNGTALQQYWCGSQQSNQEWQFRPAATSGYYAVFNRNATSLVWDDSNGSKSNGNKIQLWTYGSGNTNQEWQAVSLGSNLWKFVNLTSGLCLDNTGSKSAGVQMTQYTCQSGNTNQEFTLTQEP